MFAVLAAIVFFVAAFGGKIGDVNLLLLGLGFLALEFAFAWHPWQRWLSGPPR